MSIEAVIEGFHFLRPAWLLLLPLLVLLVWRLSRMRLQSGSWQAVCDAAFLPHLLMGREAGRQRHGKLIAVAVVGLLSIIALAGPAWKQLDQPVFRDQSALVVLLDLSRSMDATDVRPTRLTRARHKLLDILKRRREGQTALVVYAAEPFVVAPLTEDAETISAQVGSLKTALMPSQGSRPDLALDLAQRLLQQAGALNGELLLISDGLENVPQSPLSDAVAELVAAGYRLSVLGVGTADGAPIALSDGGFLKDNNGEIVIPRLDDAALRALAQSGNGRYQALRVDDRDVALLLADGVTGGEALAESTQGFKTDRWREEGPWLLLLLMPLVLVAFRRGNLLVITVVVLPLISLSPVSNLQAAERSWWDELWLSADQRGARAFERNAPAEAAQQFNDREWQAAAHYRAGDYSQSIKALDGIDSAEALYNKGNAHAQLGQWQAALEAYEQALAQRPDHEDAKYNRDLVLEQLKQPSADQSEERDSSAQSDQSQQQGDQSQQGDTQQDESQQHGEQEQSQQGSDQQEGTEAGDASDTQQVDQQQASSSGDRSGEETQPMMDRADPAQGEENGDESLEGLREMAQQSGEEGEQGEAQQQTAIAPSELSEAQIEAQQANDQWLRRIPDDPGGLLRRKFQYQSQRAQQRSGGQQRVEEQSW